MSLSQWLKGFKDLHEKAKRGALSERELAAYHAARDELARALLSAQHIALQPGQRPRQALRASRALQADIEFHDGTVRAMTLSISAGGFGALLAKPPRVDDEAKVVIRVPGGDPLRCEVRTLQVKQQVGNSRVAFQFVALPPADAERIETFVFDAILEQLEAR